MLKKYLTIPLIFFNLLAHAQDKNTTYHFKINDPTESITTLFIDSTITILKKRLDSKKVKNYNISFNKQMQEFVLKNEFTFKDEFVEDNLLKVGRLFIYECYTDVEIISILEKQRKMKNAISTIKQLNKYLRNDCLLTYEKISTITPEATVGLYALKNNKNKMDVNAVLDSVLTSFDNKIYPAIIIKFNSIGEKIFADLTEKNNKKKLAIVNDGIVYSGPIVNGRIEGGNIQISGSFTIEETKNFVETLSLGCLPLKLIWVR
jgi:preprotein translocase subunit SecD